MNTRSATYGYKTGDEMDKYLEEDIMAYGSYDKAKDDVSLTLCPEDCGGPVIGHQYDANNKCKRKSSPAHEDLTKEESLDLIESIKLLPNWNKAKLMWTTTLLVVLVTAATRYVQTSMPCMTT